MPTPRALPAPQEPIVLLTESLVQRAFEVSRESDRKRVIVPFHKSAEDNPHRMFNAMQPGTYVRPHRHLAVPKSEVFLVLRGALDFVVFAEDGTIELARTLRAGSEDFGIDLAPGLFHGLLVREPDTLVYEVKPGPYAAADDKDFASWAPAEGDPGVPAYVAALEHALARYRV
ncbi:MAG TPA: WbuC family cupin fold metalloprotein [Polyangiales bacterium]|nr:WbuC family cupin fold metalloprotein [Polyangiales bacterium]